MAVTGGRVGVLYVLHGGMDTYNPQYLWDASVQMFAYDHNHPVYHMVIWNAEAWSMVLQTEFAVKFMRKYAFEYERIGGTDPFFRISLEQLEEMKAQLDKNDCGLTFETDYACWMAADRVEHYPYPRFIYNGPDGSRDSCTYCGQDEPGGAWEGCDPERYNVDGPAERLLGKGVDCLVVVDMTVGGVRFYKTFDVVQMTRRVLQEWNRQHGTAIPLVWVNDYSGLMDRAYPTEPQGWTPMLGDPQKAPPVAVSGSPNPVAADPELAMLHVEGIEAGMSPAVTDAKTGILLFNHGIFASERRFFDPKIDDTTVLNRNIKTLLLHRHPGLDPDNVVGAYGGVKEINPENGLVERTRNMRGEDLAYAYALGSDRDMPEEEWGYRYWDALDYLKGRGVQHIVIGFPQVVSDSVLTMVELYNQIGKEIGACTWLKHAQGDRGRYPGTGHPLAQYWGNWVDTQSGDSPAARCCLTMGGCGDARVYPPPRQTPLETKREDMDPSLAFDVSAYGHLGYDPALGPPASDGPVQNQYAGTWELYVPPNSNPRLGRLLARHVIDTLLGPRVYITNGGRQAAATGEKTVWHAHAAGGAPDYSYAWSVKKDTADIWSGAGDGSDCLQWTPGRQAAGSWSVRCTVVDAEGRAGEVVWAGFMVTDSA